MTYSPDRRSVLTMAVAGGSAMMLPNLANAAVTAFKQGVAEAASSDDDLARFYREANYAPIWTGEGDAVRRSSLLNALHLAGDHGLPSGRYTQEAFVRLFSDVDSARSRGFAEVEASRMYLSYARDMQSGAIENPEAVDAGIVRALPRRDRVELLKAVAGTTPEATIRSLIPTDPRYTRLLKVKMELEQALSDGGWGPTVQANSLRVGDTGNSVISLRNRLIRMGYLSRSTTATYDTALERAVQNFQIDHGLEADGAAGAATMRAINTEPLERLQSVIVGLERERWINFEGGLGARHVFVNIADFHVQIYDDNKVTFETRSVVGRARIDKRTPEFSDQMEHMVINPTWYVPRSIATKEYLPNMQRNPNAHGYLRIVDGRGREVSRASIDFSQYTERNFPFDMRQPPSNRNALGLVKFMFPNRHNIYLHDSPAKNLFDREVRTYSSGCVRLAKPFDFGYAILAKQEADAVTYFQSILRTGEETHVDLDQNVPVHITYCTAWVPPKGRAQYRTDIYGRDAALWSAMARAGVALRAVQS